MYQTTSVPRPELVIQAAHENNQIVLSKYYHYLKNKIQHSSGLRSSYDGSLFDQVFEEGFDDAFIILLNKIKSPGFVNHNLDGFAYQIIRGKTRDELKKFNALSKIDSIDVNGLDIPDNFSTHHHILDWIEDHPEYQLDRWYHNLSIEQKEILNLRFLNYDHKEIAAELQLSEGTIRNKFSKIIQSARTYINPALAA
jgi:RNA polymerase sigma factor (sigma-70 family)